MSGLVWIRELSQDERSLANGARTGDLLDDGSVLLLQEDMNRMGLDALRNWIQHRVLEEETPIVVANSHLSPLQPVMEEIS